MGDIFTFLVLKTFLFAGSNMANGFLLGLLFCVVVAPTVAAALSGLVFVDRGRVVMGSTLTEISRILGTRPLDVSRRPSRPGSGSMRLGGIACDCSNGGSTLSSVALGVNTYRAMTFINPSNNNGSALTYLATEFFSPRGNGMVVNKASVHSVSGGRLVGAISFIFRGDHLVGTSVLRGMGLNGPGTSGRSMVGTLGTTRYASVVRGFPSKISAMVNSGKICLSNNRTRHVTVTETVLGSSPVIVLSRTATFTSPSGRIGIRTTVHRLSGNGAMVVVTRELSAITGTSGVFILSSNGLTRRNGFSRLHRHNKLFDSV